MMIWLVAFAAALATNATLEKVYGARVRDVLATISAFTALSLVLTLSAVATYG